jgi:hypothetical protein
MPLRGLQPAARITDADGALRGTSAALVAQLP